MRANGGIKMPKKKKTVKKIVKKKVVKKVKATKAVDPVRLEVEDTFSAYGLQEKVEYRRDLQNDIDKTQKAIDAHTQFIEMAVSTLGKEVEEESKDLPLLKKVLATLKAKLGIVNEMMPELVVQCKHCENDIGVGDDFHYSDNKDEDAMFCQKSCVAEYYGDHSDIECDNCGCDIGSDGVKMEGYVYCSCNCAYEMKTERASENRIVEQILEN
jgi:hypothetical protein